MNKKTIATFAVVTVLGLGILGSSSAFAQSASNSQSPMSSLVQRVAEKFGLNQTDVQAVFDEAHEEKKAEKQANFETKLSQYVADGKITEDQKQLILQKRTELDAQRETNKESMQNLSGDERRAKMEEERSALEAWATENGIDIQYLMPQGGRGHGGFRGPGERPADAPEATVAPTTTQ